MSTGAVPRSEDVEPDIRHYLDNEYVEYPNPKTATVAEIRDHFAAMRTAGAAPEVAEVVNTSFEGSGGSVPIRIYRADTSRNGVVLWFHGGGWVLGDLDTAEMPARSLCVDTGCTVVSVDYRLAPEAPFPGAFDDSVAALTWLLANASELNIDPTKVVVGGDSAGGNLAAALAQSARDAGTGLAGQLLIYPATEAPSPSYGLVDFGYGLSRAAMHWFWSQYVPVAADMSDWRATPASGDLSGVADAFVQTCGFDPLAAEGLRYAQLLRSAGVAVTVDHLPGSIHGSFAMGVDAGRRSRESAAQWVSSKVR